MPIESLVVTIDSLLDSALAEEPADRPYAATELLPHLDRSQLERVWTLGTEAATHPQRVRVLRELVDFLDPERAGEVLEIARNMPDDGWRTSLFRALVPNLAPEERPAVLDQILDETEPAWHAATGFRDLLPLMSPQQVTRLADLILADADQREAASAVAGLAEFLPSGVRERAWRAVLEIADGRFRAAVLVRWAPHATAAEARHLLADAERLPAGDARGAVLTAVATSAGLSEEERTTVVRAALREVHHGLIMNMLPRLAAILDPADQGVLLTRAGPGLPVDVARYLDDERLEQALRTVEDDGDAWLVAAAECLDHLSAGRRGAVQDRCVEIILARGLVDRLPKLVGRLREEQYAALIPLALTLPAGDVQGLIALAPKLDREQRDEALRAVRSLPDARRCADLVTALAPHLDQDQLTVAATRLPPATAGPVDRVVMLVALARAATGDLRSVLTAKAVAGVVALEEPWRGAEALLEWAGAETDDILRDRLLDTLLQLSPRMDPGDRTRLRVRMAGLLGAERRTHIATA
ncbi:hypothetical protein AB0G04_16230 [Actinoplanes sp. NPDC023801]|uniref:hypothetical protein n=1 Tax=Actinoplanes sp. NPDC023801 TaxID=3154595 RepID=UPI0033FC4008